MLTIGQPARLISCLPRGLETKFDEFKRCLKWIHAEGGMDDVSKILASVEALFLFRHWTLEKLSTFNLLKLKYCLLAECNEMETLVDASGPSEYVETRTRDGEKVGLELLQYLSIHHMYKLQSIWKGAIGKDTLSKLKILALHTCPQLTSIFSPRFAQNLLCLTELIVEDCPKVISLISSESHNVKHGPIFPSLERIFFLDLPELVNIFGGLYVLEELDTLLIYNCLKLRLSIMELPDIKKIEGENEWWNDLDCDKSPWENIFVPLKEGRDLIEQLYEATDSLNHFHNIRFEENDELKSSAEMSMEKGKETLFPTEVLNSTFICKMYPNKPTSSLSPEMITNFDQHKLQVNDAIANQQSLKATGVDQSPPVNVISVGQDMVLNRYKEESGQAPSIGDVRPLVPSQPWFGGGGSYDGLQPPSFSDVTRGTSQSHTFADVAPRGTSQSDTSATGVQMPDAQVDGVTLIRNNFKKYRLS